jgi:hypothetical protein
MVKLGRIPVPLLRRHDRAVNIAVAKRLAALERRGHLLQERVAIGNAQRARGAEDCVELFVVKSDRRSARPT